MWKISTGHCLKIFRGHRDTVLTIKVLEDLMISGGKDNACRGKFLRRHYDQGLQQGCCIVVVLYKPNLGGPLC